MSLATTPQKAKLLKRTTAKPSFTQSKNLVQYLQVYVHLHQKSYGKSAAHLWNLKKKDKNIGLMTLKIFLLRNRTYLFLSHFLLVCRIWPAILQSVNSFKICKLLASNFTRGKLIKKFS